MLATELSRNEKKLQYAESDGESLLMTFRTWRSLKGEKADEFLKSLGKNLSSGLAQVLNHQESREFLVALDDMQPHFHYTEPFTTTWIKRYLHGISGGVSNSSYFVGETHDVSDRHLYFSLRNKIMEEFAQQIGSFRDE